MGVKKEGAWVGGFLVFPTRERNGGNILFNFSLIFIFGAGGLNFPGNLAPRGWNVGDLGAYLEGGVYQKGILLPVPGNCWD